MIHWDEEESSRPGHTAVRGRPQHCRLRVFLLWCLKEYRLAEICGAGIPGESSMDVAIHLPDDIAQRIQAQWEDVPRHVLESFVLEGFRAHVLTTEDVRRLLGFETKIEVHAFFKAHDVPFYTLADLEHDRDTSRKLGL
jgi:hypothetical protein